MNIVLIGNGAIAGYVMKKLAERGHRISAIVVRPERLAQMDDPKPDQPLWVSSVGDFPSDVDHVIDCAGHSGLAAYGPQVLRAGYDLTTVSVGALAHADLAHNLSKAAADGGSRLHLASGAIGGLDCLQAARVGKLASVRYVGRKPPRGWIGSVAADKIDLMAMTADARTHFTGSAREAAIEYPKNANVAATVALAGLGFDNTEVELIADPRITRNIHEIHAEGEFGAFHFEIQGNALPDNSGSSMLAAMSVVSTVERQHQMIVL